MEDRNPREETTAIHGHIPKQFRQWKGQLGWSFTAHQNFRMYLHTLAAKKFMKSFGKPFIPPPYPPHPIPTIPQSFT